MERNFPHRKSFRKTFSLRPFFSYPFQSTLFLNWESEKDLNSFNRKLFMEKMETTRKKSEHGKIDIINEA